MGTKQWDNGLYLTYNPSSGSGSATIAVSSGINEGLDRTTTVKVKGNDNVNYRIVAITQTGKRLNFITKDNLIFFTSDNLEFLILK